MEYDKELHLQWNMDVDYALVFSKWWCKAFGIWPWQDNEVLRILQTGSIILTLLITKGTCGLITDLVDTLSGIVIFSITITKILILSFHQQQLCYIISSMMHDWLNIRERKSLDIMRRYAYWGRLAFILQTAPVVADVILTIWSDPPNMESEISENNSSLKRSLILAPSCWIPITMSRSVYLLYYYFHLIAAIFVAVTYAGYIPFMFSTVIHICGQFEILEESIKNLSDGDDYSIQRYKIKKYSQRHNHLILLGNRVRSVVNIIILSVILGNTVLICASGLAVLADVKMGITSSVVLSWVARIYVMYIEIFIYCYIGEKMSSYADRLQGTLYNCRWYNMPTNNVKDIEFMIMRNNLFCHLAAGKVLIMNYESFTKITKNLFSFFSILRIMLEGH
ncbi:odorant receptor 13a-like isoform X2 [Diachasmimorpha longicaudata]|uniref:odorant receptor 13a-like isoform X2 n=1 Tax=Diachasmimorpha longicaudata TaxID=58733 RepID=UPI0030B8CDB7